MTELHAGDAARKPPGGLATLHRWYLPRAAAVGSVFVFGYALPYYNAAATAGFVLSVLGAAAHRFASNAGAADGPH